jgi:hypothetical protein
MAADEVRSVGMDMNQSDSAHTKLNPYPQDRICFNFLSVHRRSMSELKKAAWVSRHGLKKRRILGTTSEFLG